MVCWLGACQLWTWDELCSLLLQPSVVGRDSATQVTVGVSNMQALVMLKPCWASVSNPPESRSVGMAALCHK